MGVLDQDEILKVQKALVAAGLADTRGALLAGMSPAFIASLQVTAISGAQILSDLNALNDAGVLSDGSVPIRVWLKNALTLAGPRKEYAIFLEVLTRSTTLGPETTADAFPPVFTRASMLYGTGEKSKRIEADRLIERDAAAIDYEWLLSLNSGNYGKHERALMAKAIGAHPCRDKRGLSILLDALPAAPAEGGVYSYRILAALRKLLREEHGGMDPMNACTAPERCLAALDFLAAGTGSDTPTVAAQVKTLLLSRKS